MSDPKGDKLFVNLGASQTRRRLKGFGHGVRKVLTNGRHRAVIVHTALGRNLAELEAKFADVGHSRSESSLADPIDDLKNIGPTSAAWLRDASIRSIDDLKQLGPATAYRRVKRAVPQVSLNLLWALAAGLQDLDWRDLTDDDRARLLAELAED